MIVIGKVGKKEKTNANAGDNEEEGQQSDHDTDNPEKKKMGEEISNQCATYYACKCVWRIVCGSESESKTYAPVLRVGLP